MQKWLLALLVMVSFVIAPVVALAQMFHSPNGYSITAPLGWKLNKSGMMGSDIIIITKPHDNFAANVNVRFSTVPTRLTMKEVQRQLKTGYPKSFSSYQFISDKFTSLGGAPAYEILYTHKYGKPARALWVRQDLVVRGTKLYVFSCTALSSSAARSTAAFNTIIQSVHWTGK